MAVPWLLVFLVVAEISSKNSIIEAGYCSRSYACSNQRYSSQLYTIKCGVMGWQICRRYRQIGETYYRACYQSYCCLGYTGSSCSQDIDECRAGTHNCQQVCVNTKGSFNCSCMSGFLIDGDRRTCTDINECLENNGGCSHICKNKAGSYECFCANGLYLATDGKTCKDTDECLENNGGCDHICINDYTTFRCVCNVGYRIGLDEKSCVDIDECSGSNKCSQRCQNAIGSYNCSCNSGYELAHDGVTCLDIDDCVNVSCLHGGSCIDLPSAYMCHCLEGYGSDNCQTDINECLLANGGCEDQCMNTNGSFYCQCRNGRSLEEDGFSCKGDKVVPNVFEKYHIARLLLPRGCMYISLMSCKSSVTSQNVILTSTDMWYRLNKNQSILFTYGVVFAEVEDLSIPLSLNGLKVALTEDSFDIVIGSLLYKEKDGTPLNDQRYDDCLLFNLTPKDIHDFISSGSFLETLFDRIQDKLPFWLRLQKSGTGLISITDLKTELIYGQNVDRLPECIGAPVYKDRLYTVFRFGTEMSFSIYGNRIQIPAPLKGKKFCLIIDMCHKMGGTIFLMIPKESRNLLDKADYFNGLARNGLRIRPKGIGMSLANDINVSYKKSELKLWNGAEVFRYRVFQTASIWVDVDIEYSSKKQLFDVHVNGNIELFLKGPSITHLLLDLFLQEWNGLVQFSKFTVTPVRFKIGVMDIEIPFKDIVMPTLEAYFSVGGKENRVWCGHNANPPGMFVSYLMDANIFRNIPILNGWGIVEKHVQLFAFISTDNRLSLETKTDAIYEMIGLKKTVDKFRTSFGDFSKKIKRELSSVSQKAVVQIQSSISKLQTILAGILTGGESLRLILKVIKNVWTTFSILKYKAYDLQDDLEFHTSLLVKDFTDLIESEITRIGRNIDKVSSKVIDQLFLLVDSYNGVGFRFRAFVKINVLEFDVMEIEIINSVEGIGKCNKFKKVYELMSDAKAIRLVAHKIPIKTKLPKKIKFGYFLLCEHNYNLSLAVGSGKRFVAHIHIDISILGIRRTEDMLISDSGIHIYTEGNVWNIFFAKIEMSAKLVKNWFDITYNIKGSLSVASQKQDTIERSKSDFQGSYSDGILSIAWKISKEANKRLQAAQYGLNVAQEKLALSQNNISQAQEKIKLCNENFDSAIYNLENAKRKLDKVKVPYENALEKLRNAQRNVGNLCRIRSCPPICIPGCILKWCGLTPCCEHTNCLFKVPDIICHATNLVCKGIRSAAYAALDAAQIFVRIPMLAFDSAKAVLTGAQIVVDKARIFLDVAVNFLEVTKNGLQMAKVGLEVAKGAIDLLKVTLSAALHVFDFLVLDLQKAIDVKNCGFEIEMSIWDKALFEIGCDVKAFGLGWKTFRFWFDFRNPITSMWRVAKGTIDALLDSITNIFGKRKRRDISFKAMSRLHHIFKIYKKDTFYSTGNQSEYLTNTVFKTMYDNNFQNNSINEHDYRVMLFQENCLSFDDIHSFLSMAVIKLLDISNETVSQLNVMSMFNEQTPKITTETSIYDLTVESSGISAEYALKDYNLTYEDLNAILEEVKHNLTGDPLIAEVEELKREANEMTKSAINAANSVSAVPFWIFELENMTAENFNRSECANFRDCVLHSISILYDLFTDDSIENAVLNRQLMSSIEDILQILLTNDSLTVTQTHLMSLELVGHLTALNSSNMFCSTPPTFVTQPQNQTVLLGSQIHLYCNALGDPPPTIVWYFNDSMLENTEGAELTIDKATNQNSGIYSCMAGNVVTNITSGDAFILAKECPPGTFYKTESCEVCPKGSYQRNWNQRECSMCPTGFATSMQFSPSEIECIDINECTDQLSVCQQVCINTNGSYYCQCGRNYNLEKDGKTCSENNMELIIAAGVVVGVVTVVAAVVLFKLWKTRQLRKMKIRPSSGSVTISQPEQVHDTDPAKAKRMQTTN